MTTFSTLPPSYVRVPFNVRDDLEEAAMGFRWSLALRVYLYGWSPLAQVTAGDLDCPDASTIMDELLDARYLLIPGVNA